jgi:hypothetical protein
MSKRKEPVTPHLDRALASGLVRLVDMEYVGTATDGVELTVGTILDKEATDRWLASYPTPDTW